MLFLCCYLYSIAFQYPIQTTNMQFLSFSGAENFGNRSFEQGTEQTSSIKSPSKEPLHISKFIPLSISRSPLIFTPAHNQTVLCPAPPYGPSTRMPACCCTGLIRYGCSGQPERAAAARGGQRNTGPFPARGALPWAAALLGPWGTRAEQERRLHSPQPSSLCHSSWKWGNVLKVEIVYCVDFISEEMRNVHGSAGSPLLAISKPRRRSHVENVADVNSLNLATVFPTRHRAKK